MIDWLFEPASNWLVIVLILWVLAYIYSKEFADAKRFKFIADALARIPAADRKDDRCDGEDFY